MGIIAFTLLDMAPSYKGHTEYVVDFKALGIVGISFLNPRTKIRVFRVVVKCWSNLDLTAF